VPAEGDQRVGVELGQGDVPGANVVSPPGQAGGLSRDILEECGPAAAGSVAAHILELSLGDLPTFLVI